MIAPGFHLEDWGEEPGFELHAIAGDGGAARAAGSCPASPPIFTGVDRARAEVIHANAAAEELIEMRVNFGGSVGDDVVGFVGDDVAEEDSSGDGRDAEDVDAGGAGSGGVFRIRAIAGNDVAGHDVIVEVFPGAVGVEGDAGKAVVLEDIAKDEIFGDAAAGKESEDADACSSARNFGAVVSGFVVDDGVFKNAVWRASAGERRMRGESDAAIVRIVADDIAGDEIGIKTRFL